MRSLTLKLTLAFLVVGLAGTLLVAFFVGQRTTSAFSQFVVDRRQATMIATLSQYYATHGSWEGVVSIISPDDQNGSGDQRRPLEIVSMDGRIIVTDGHYPVGAIVPVAERARGVPIMVNGTPVGLLLNVGGRGGPGGPGTPEGDFLARLEQALIYGAVGATAVALLLGFVLAKTLTQPIRELTTATRIVAKGQLGKQVVVRSRDELGTLAASFNRMSADLLQSSNLRRQMTADIAHDLRTPLSVILGYTEALRDGKLPGTDDIYDTLYTEARHLQHLVDDLRTLSLADAGELPLNPQTMDPRALLDRVAAAYSRQAQDRNVAVQLNAAADLPPIAVDPERMAQVLGNLVSNALRYTPAGGRLTLAADVGIKVVHLHVADTGKGISPEDLPHVFERFYRGDQARGLGEGSSGLGLAIAKALVEAHGGTIAVASTRGVGTTFTITIPVLDTALVEAHTLPERTNRQLASTR